MKLDELIQEIKTDNTKAFQGMKDEQAVSIVRAAFQHLRAKIDATGEGKFDVPGLGKIIVKQVARKGEEKPGVIVKRVVLREFNAKPKGTKKKKSAASK